MINRAIIALSLLGFGASGALAQEVEQIAATAPRGDAVEQISGGNQLPAPQLTSERRIVRAPLQLNRSGRTAEPSEALSVPSEGRTGAVAAVGGSDRCDEAADNAATRAACARVIETRSAEFEPEPITLSPEQRLLVEQRLREAPARSRLAESGLDPDSVEEQAVASVTLRPATRPERDDDKEGDRSAAEAAAAAVVSAIVNGPGAPPPN